jgi:Protein of unknown function (DUF669)
MARLMQPFNATQFDPTQGTGALPVGKHLVVATASEVKPAKTGNSGLVEFELQVIEGEFKGSTGGVRFNLYNESQQAVEIAHRQFSSFCTVVGVLNPEGTEQLHNIPFMVEVALQKEPNPNKYTEVKKFFDAQGNAATTQQPATQSGFGGGQQVASNVQMPATQEQTKAGWGNGQQTAQQPTTQISGGAAWTAGGGQTANNGTTWGTRS